MTSEDAREMDRRCVLKWLYDMNTNPRATLERYEDDIETLEILSYDAFMLLLTSQEKQQLRQERNTQRFFADTDGKITPLPVVVRCEHCANRGNTQTCPVAYIEKEDGYKFIGLNDWFCGNGKPKTNENK